MISDDAIFIYLLLQSQSGSSGATGSSRSKSNTGSGSGSNSGSTTVTPEEYFDEKFNLNGRDIGTPKEIRTNINKFKVSQPM